MKFGKLSEFRICQFPSCWSRFFFLLQHFHKIFAQCTKKFIRLTFWNVGLDFNSLDISIFSIFRPVYSQKSKLKNLEGSTPAKTLLKVQAASCLFIDKLTKNQNILKSLKFGELVNLESVGSPVGLILCFFLLFYV